MPNSNVRNKGNKYPTFIVQGLESETNEHQQIFIIESKENGSFPDFNKIKPDLPHLM